MLLKEHSLCIYFYFIQKIYLCHSTFTLYPLYCISKDVMFINFHIHVQRVICIYKKMSGELNYKLKNKHI